MTDDETPHDDPETPRTLTLAQVAADLQVSWDTAARRARAGEIPAFKVGVSWRVDAAEFARWKRARTRAETSRRQRTAGVL
jgi:excisionase family DNA binding protein